MSLSQIEISEHRIRAVFGIHAPRTAMNRCTVDACRRPGVSRAPATEVALADGQSPGRCRRARGHAPGAAVHRCLSPHGRGRRGACFADDSLYHCPVDQNPPPDPLPRDRAGRGVNLSSFRTQRSGDPESMPDASGESPCFRHGFPLLRERRSKNTLSRPRAAVADKRIR